MIELTENAFEQEVLQSAAPVLIDFHAVWCGPCKLVAPILSEIAKERPDLKIAKVDVDQEGELARRHSVMSVPTLVLYRQGKVAGTWIGLRSKQALLQDVDKALAS